MFDVLASEKLVLTLQFMPPFGVASALILILMVLLVASLMMRLYFLLKELLKIFIKTVIPSAHRVCKDRVSQSLTIHYPASVIVDSTSSSSLHLGTIRKIGSMLTLQNAENCLKKSNRYEDRTQERIDKRESRKRKCLSLDDPSSLVTTESNHPTIDIPDFDYKAYRHKLIEAGLRKQYDDFQPPGDVVLNSIHLNSADSIIDVDLNDRYDHSLFDFIDHESYKLNKSVMRQKKSEHLHLLDHFLVKSIRKSETVEKETETIDDNIDRISFTSDSTKNHVAENINNNFLKVDNNGNPCNYLSQQSILHENGTFIIKGDRSSKLGIYKEKIIPISQSHKHLNRATPKYTQMENDRRYTTIESSWMTRSRPMSAGNNSMVSKAPTLCRAATLSGSKKITKSPRSKISTDSLRGYKKKLRDYPEEFPLNKQATRRANDISASSSEIGSIYSDSSKHQDEISCYSRESSTSSKSHKRPPWLSGNHRTSFNRKYGNIKKDSARSGWPISAHKNNLSQKLTVPYKTLPKESSSISTNYSPMFLKQKAKSFIVSQKKEIIEMSADQDKKQATEFSCQPQDEVKDIESTVVENNGKGKTPRSPDSSRKIISPSKMPISRISDNVTSFLSSGDPMQVKPTRLPHSSSADAPAAASIAVPQTLATKEPRLTTRSADVARKKLLAESTRYSKLPLMQEQRENLAKLNGSRRQPLRSANSTFSKNVPLNPKIELPAEVLNPVDDQAAEHTLQINLRKNVKMSKNDEIQTALYAEENVKEARASNVKTCHTNNLTQSKVPRIIQNLRTKPAGAGNLSKSYKSSLTSRTAQRNANSEERNGLNATKLNTRSNDLVDKTKCDKFSRESSTLCENSTIEETKEKDITGNNIDQKLKLPRCNSKVGLAMNSALKKYVERLKQGLLDCNNKDGIALASLSLTEGVSISPEQKASLSFTEIQELQDVLTKIEKNPELLYKESPFNMKNVV